MLILFNFFAFASSFSFSFCVGCKTPQVVLLQTGCPRFVAHDPRSCLAHPRLYWHADAGRGDRAWAKKGSGVEFDGVHESYSIIHHMICQVLSYIL